MTTVFNTVLIANRGEIALRILRACRSLGLRVIAVHSEADAGSRHVALADQAVCIGPAPAKASYLNAAEIVLAARLTGAQAIHPGYGFLSEDADFAAAVEAGGAGVWVGPPSGAIRLMGDKVSAKRAMIAAGVPCVPGSEARSARATVRRWRALARDDRLPADYQGGRRWRRTRHARSSRLRQSWTKPTGYHPATRPAQAFRNSEVYLEKFLQHGRGISRSR